MPGRSTITIDRAAIAFNAARLRERTGTAALWAVVKANGYGDGATDVAAAALRGGASALCVATVGEALGLRRALPDARILVMGPTAASEIGAAREARLELVVGDGPLPEGLPVHLKLDTGMGRWGLGELPAPGRDVVGLMTHFASADSDAAFTRTQLERFLIATAPYPSLTRHAANSAATLMLPEAHLDAVRCGIALYGVDPLGEDASAHGLRPALRWSSSVAAVKLLRPGESTGYGRRFTATSDTWIGLVPVGYADGFRRDLTGTEILVDGRRAKVVGVVSMDALAVALDRRAEPGAAVTLVGEGITLEQHARVAGTIAYEIACGIRSDVPRAEREVIG